MIFDHRTVLNSPLKQAIDDLYMADEKACVESLIGLTRWSPLARKSIQLRAAEAVAEVRAAKDTHSNLDAFLHEYNLSSDEGIMLMCLAEALLRIPDSHTADKLIRDKISVAKWSEHLGHSKSILVNASTWGLMLTGKLMTPAEESEADLGDSIREMISRLGEPVIRTALRQAMKILGQQFVCAENIRDAIEVIEDEPSADRYSFDMLGEAAVTQADADKYFSAYSKAIEELANQDFKSLADAASISIKLSALHPRYEFSHYVRVLDELVPKVKALALQAKEAGIGLTLDAEEAERLSLSLDVFERVFENDELKAWSGFGLAVQAYQKRALKVIEWLIALAKKNDKRIPVRLVKGAYWDSEIKHAQINGWPNYPVFTRKENTDLSYLACAQLMLKNSAAIYSQFATHNAHTIASVCELAESHQDFEFQRLHGMGEALYQYWRQKKDFNIPVRVYAPIGAYQELLPYLVRRLLENGANTSFVHRIEDASVPVSQLVADPLLSAEANVSKSHPKIPLPADIFQPSRQAAIGMNFSHIATLKNLSLSLTQFESIRFKVEASSESSKSPPEKTMSVVEPTKVLAEKYVCNEEELSLALNVAVDYFPTWRNFPVVKKAEIFQRAADIFESQIAEFVYLIVHEGGRSVVDAVAEVRETIDFCRYYSEQGCSWFSQSQQMLGPTGEENMLRWRGRGVFVCISPWNFPVAIFTGQVVAALMAGNTVLAKPASQTSLCAFRCVQVLYQAGVPKSALQFLPSTSTLFSKSILNSRHVAGVAFTGSTASAKNIQKQLASREGGLVRVIAETGGQNVLIADSSALPEQLAKDVTYSAFNSAGQRCSALRILIVQSDIAERVIDLLSGMIAELNVANPFYLDTDVGPLIDSKAADEVRQHCDRLIAQGRLIARATLPELSAGNVVAPCMFRIHSIDELSDEVFGPVLHVMTYDADELDDVLAQINATGYGLTLGIHSRIGHVVSDIQDKVNVGNIYVNRNIVGAAVGVQPFGGQGLSGTGPKAGGPHYLLGFATEQTLTNNTSSVGGNVRLLGTLD